MKRVITHVSTTIESTKHESKTNHASLGVSTITVGTLKKVVGNPKIIKEHPRNILRIPNKIVRIPRIIQGQGNLI